MNKTPYTKGHIRRGKSFVFLFMAVLFTVDIHASEVVFCKTTESKINSYAVGLLKLVLKNTNGEHRLSTLNVPYMNKKRLFTQMKDKDGPCSVVINGASTLFNNNIDMVVTFPITRGLLGYRVLVFNQQTRANWTNINSLEQIKNNFTIGSGAHWHSSTLFKEHGFTVVHGNTTQLLWLMLKSNRFDLLNRGILESEEEVNQRLALGDEVYIDKKFVFHLKLDFFFIVKDGDTNTKQLLTQGLETAYNNGSYQQYLDQYLESLFINKKNILDGRKVLELEYQDMPELIKVTPDKYWYKFEKSNH
ncbi:hypothetical protein [Paraglaciecola sp. L3A3]|uniref:hypothetical protein n=1 Tax=Paraglaciecola sp. L3A3 TaxID=2686358 RepID=UPI00131B89F5|nr:hypothetical protein [Paraglaciecola sp. L3A3]